MIRPPPVVEHDPAWADRFEGERARIEAAGGPDAFLAIEHIGSTSVPGLPAKPIIDVMPGVASLDDALDLIPRLCAIGYVYVPELERLDAERRYFRKDVRGVRAFQLHLAAVGSAFWVDQLMFRDHLRSNPAAAEAFARLKRELAGAAYTDGKIAFMDEVLAGLRRGA